MAKATLDGRETAMTKPQSLLLKTLVDEAMPDCTAPVEIHVDGDDYVEVRMPRPDGTDYVAVRLELRNGRLTGMLWSADDTAGRDDYGPTFVRDLGPAPRPKRNVKAR